MVEMAERAGGGAGRSAEPRDDDAGDAVIEKEMGRGNIIYRGGAEEERSR